MQINTNTTGMLAELTIATDKDARDHCVVVVKGTFEIDDDGEPYPASKQEPLVVADIHRGDPAETSLVYECEFAPTKPMVDILVNGEAVAPGGRPVRELTVALEIGGLRKEARVVGDRQWKSSLLGFVATEPVPFKTMPLIYERAFGGSDHTHSNPKYHGTEPRNTVGIGFHRNSDASSIEGLALPNLEDPRKPMRSWSDTPPPIGFGAVGRNWQPRLAFAGTYDKRWREARFPFLPEDFDTRYFQSAPADQQLPALEGGEVIRCRNMNKSGLFEASVPRLEVPVEFRFRDRPVHKSATLDTVIVEPGRGLVIALWRTSAPLGRKFNALREVVVGRHPVAARARTDGKRRFGSLEELAAWNRERGGPPARRTKS